MTYQPLKTKTARSRSFGFIAVGVLLWMTAGIITKFAGFFQLGAIALIVVGVWYLTRYELSDFRYILEDDDFIIYRTQGARDAKVCHIALAKGKALFRLADEPKFEQKYGKTVSRFNYCQNPEKNTVWVLLFADGDRLIEVRFEPDETFVNAMQKAMNGDMEGLGFVM